MNLKPKLQLEKVKLTMKMMMIFGSEVDVSPQVLSTTLVPVVLRVHIQWRLQMHVLSLHATNVLLKGRMP